jgi:hypothetical protein
VAGDHELGVQVLLGEPLVAEGNGELEPPAPRLENSRISSSLPSPSSHSPYLWGFLGDGPFPGALVTVTEETASLSGFIAGVTVVTLVTVFCGCFLSGTGMSSASCRGVPWAAHEGRDLPVDPVRLLPHQIAARLTFRCLSP